MFSTFRSFCLSLFCFSAMFAASSQSLDAECIGDDLRPAMSPQDRAELGDLLRNMPYSAGNHWQARRGIQTVHVIGTMHLDDPKFAAILRRLTPILITAEKILLEATQVEMDGLEALLSQRPDLLMIAEGPTIPELLPEQDWKRLMAAGSARGIPSFMLAKMQPWYLSMILGLPPCAIAEMASGAEGLDKMIIDIAQANDVPMAALEPMDTMLHIFGEVAREEQVRYLTAYLQSPKEGRDVLETLRASYFEEKHGEIWHFGNLHARRTTDIPPAELQSLLAELRRLMLTNRNANWLPQIIQNLPEAGGHIVVAVGAAHLSGSDGILHMLAEEGFELTRLPF